MKCYEIPKMQWNLDLTNLIKEEVFNTMNDFLQPGQNTRKRIEQKLDLTNPNLKRVWILEVWSENVYGKLHFLVWNRVRIWRTGRYTTNSQEYSPSDNYFP